MMRPGTYLVGDLCYVMHPQWHEVCGLMFATDGPVLEGEFNLSNGVRFALSSTAYGDGTYYDGEGRSYPVDAGLIGCIRKIDVADPEAYFDGMNEIVFDNPFHIEYNIGTIMFVEHMPGGDKEVVLSIETAEEYA